TVDTHGAEDAAESAPTLRKIKVSIEPDSVHQSTTPTSAMPTVSATRGQCAPYGCRWKYCSPTIAHAPTRTMPIVPRIAPNASPARTSRLITRHQSRRLTSPSAIARIIKVDASDQ